METGPESVWDGGGEKYHLLRFLPSNLGISLASPVVLAVKKPPASAGDAKDADSTPDQEDPLEKGMATPVFLPGESHGQD